MDRATMVAYLRSDASAGDLTHAAEIAGTEMGCPEVIEALIDLLKHPRPMAREGALYGLSHHIKDAAVLAAVKHIANEDECDTIRQVAEGVLP